MIAKHKQAGPMPQRLKFVEPEDSDLVGKVHPHLGDSGRAQEVMTAFQRLAEDQAFNNES
ncbi:hypothetical protein PLESTF_001975800, partial [Pleodorina starrii]